VSRRPDEPSFWLALFVSVALVLACAGLAGCGERELRGDPWDPLGLHLR